MRTVDMTTAKIPEGARQVIKFLKCMDYEAYLVGGCVRDMLMGKKPHDYDICTDAVPSDIIRVLTRYNVPYGTIGIAFGTVVAYLDDGEYEITTFRKDKVTSGKHRPDVVEFSTSVSDDLSRRDFTINAIALDITTGELIDLYGGVEDIELKIIRAVNDPSVRMQEDPLRILRALRFAITLQFYIEGSTLKAMHANKELLDNISKERITQEFRKIFNSGKPVREVFMDTSDIIVQIIPEMSNCVNFSQNNRYHKHDVYEHILYVVDYCDTTDFEIKMAALFHDIAKPEAYFVGEDGFGHFYGHPAMSKEKATLALVKDFRLTTEETMNILTLIEQHDNDISATKKSVKKLLNIIGPDLMEKWFVLKQADRADHIYPDNRHFMDIPKLKEIFMEVMEEKQCFKLKDLNISGNDVMSLLGIKPGKSVGIILDELLQEVIADEIPNDFEVLKERAKQICEEENLK